MGGPASFEESGFDPYAEQRELFELLSQETRHQIIQTVLGHPEHLVSLDELEFAVQKSKAAILDQLDLLTERDILREYEHPGRRKRGHPESYYGPTEYGIEVLGRYNYLRAVPVLRALYDNTVKTAKVERHEDAPRPSLPEKVHDALHFETPIAEEPTNEHSVDLQADDSKDATTSQEMLARLSQGGPQDSFEPVDDHTRALPGLLEAVTGDPAAVAAVVLGAAIVKFDGDSENSNQNDAQDGSEEFSDEGNPESIEELFADESITSTSE